MTNIVEVEADSDFRETTFSVSGFLNFIFRYGGGIGPVTKKRAALAKNAEPFTPLRKFVLETSDNDQTKKILDKIYCYDGGKNIYSGKSSKTKSKKEQNEAVRQQQRIKNLEAAIKSNPLYKTIPKVTIINYDSKFDLCSNTNVAPVHGTNIYMQPTNLNLELYADKNLEAGKIPAYRGSIDIEFWSKTKNKKINILQEIVRNPNTLGYLFGWTNTWGLTLENKKVSQNFASAQDRKKYEALIAKKISIFATTASHELTSWKPYENRAVFSLRFMQAVEPRESVAKSGVSGVNLEQPRDAPPKKDNVPVQSFMDAIIRQLSRNGSLFFYTIKEHPKNNDKIVYAFQRGSATGTTAAAGAGGAAPTIAHGSMFLLRSLIIATIQTFYRDTTQLNKDVYSDILFDKKAFDKFLLFIDETNMPTEVGTRFSEGADLRNTFETMAVEFNIFSLFLNQFSSKYTKTTFDFFMEKIFTDLVPMILKSSLSSKGPDRGRYRTIGGDNVIFNMTQKGIQNSFGQGYSIRTRLINENRITYSSPKNTIFRARDRIDVVPRNLKSAGSLRVKNISGRTVLAALFETTEKMKNAMIIDRNDDTESIIISNEQRIKIAMASKPQLISNGVISIDWYSKTNPKENLQYRLKSDGGNSPFSFSAIEDKHIQTARLTAAGEKPFRKNVYSVSFSVTSVLGIEPNRVTFFFPPSLFGFANAKEDFFGFSGAYNCRAVSISYTKEVPYFVTNVEGNYQVSEEAKQRALIKQKKDNEKLALEKAYANSRHRDEIADIRKDKDKGAHRRLVAKTKRAIEETEKKIQRLKNPDDATILRERGLDRESGKGKSLKEARLGGELHRHRRKDAIFNEELFLNRLKKQLKTEEAYAAKREKEKE